MTMKEILVVGGGFAGLWASLSAADEALKHGGDIHITLFSRDEYLTIRPRLYEKNPETLRVPLRPCLDSAGIPFVRGIFEGIDMKNRIIHIQNGGGESSSRSYDRLILAVGSELQKLPVHGIEENSWNNDTYDAAVALDRHLREILQAPDAPEHHTLVIIGAGMSGIELAMEMRGRIEVHADSKVAERVRVILVDRNEVVCRDFGENSRQVIEEALQSARVETRLGVGVTRIDPDGLDLSNGERIEAATVIITAGIRPNSLARTLFAEFEEEGFLPVDEMLRVKGVPEVYAAGDIARVFADGEHFALMSCQHAKTMGKYAGHNAARELLDLPLRPYRQMDYSTTLDLGSAGAIITSGWDRQVKVTGEKAKERKRMINTEWIYPPRGTREEILAAARIDERGR